MARTDREDRAAKHQQALRADPDKSAGAQQALKQQPPRQQPVQPVSAPPAKTILREKRTLRYANRLVTLNGNRLAAQDELGAPELWALSLTDAKVQLKQPRGLRRAPGRCTIEIQATDEPVSADDDSRRRRASISRSRPGVRGQRRVVLKAKTPLEAEKWVRLMRRAARDSVEEWYILGSKLGRGTYGQVVVAEDMDNGQKVAIKAVDRSKIAQAKELEFLEREIQLAAVIDHPSCIRTHRVFDNGQLVNFVMDLAQQDLFDTIAQENNFTEKLASDIIKQVLAGVNYLHSKNIVHRDLKPENILCVSTDPISVKISDFGTARFVVTGRDGKIIDQPSSDVGPRGNVMATNIGTAYYMAPELLSNSAYSFPVDLWACGVILFAMIAGRLPWPATDEADYCRLATTSPVHFPESEWQEVSPDAKDFIRALLNPDPATRLTAQEATAHYWLRPSGVRSIKRIPTDRSLLAQSKRGSFRFKTAGSLQRHLGIADQPNIFNIRSNEKLAKLSSIVHDDPISNEEVLAEIAQTPKKPTGNFRHVLDRRAVDGEPLSDNASSQTNGAVPLSPNSPCSLFIDAEQVESESDFSIDETVIPNVRRSIDARPVFNDLPNRAKMNPKPFARQRQVPSQMFQDPDSPNSSAKRAQPGVIVKVDTISYFSDGNESS